MKPFRSSEEMLDAHELMFGEAGRQCAEVVLKWAGTLFAVPLNTLNIRVVLAPVEIGPYNRHTGYCCDGGEGKAALWDRGRSSWDRTRARPRPDLRRSCRGRSPRTLAGCEVNRRTASARLIAPRSRDQWPSRCRPKPASLKQVRVGASVAQADDAVRVVEHPADRVLVAVQELRGEHRLQVVGEGDVEHRVERVAAVGAGDRGDAALLVPAEIGSHRLDDMDLVPFAVEEAKRRRRLQLGADGVAERAVGEHRLELAARAAERRLPARQAFDRIRRREGEVHRQRTARDLAEQAVAARVGGGDGVEVVEHRLGAMLLWSSAATITGRPVAAASDSRNATFVCAPLVSM